MKPDYERETVVHVRHLEARRYEAMRQGDVDVLGELLSADLIYTHSFGDRDSKSSYLEKVRAGVFRYETISTTEERIVVLGTAALVAGTMTALVTIEGSRRTLNNASLAVWSQHRDGAWLLVGYQPTPLAKPA